jgi:hypothetical protein
VSGRDPSHLSALVAEEDLVLMGAPGVEAIAENVEPAAGDGMRGIYASDLRPFGGHVVGSELEFPFMITRAHSANSMRP